MSLRLGRICKSRRVRWVRHAAQMEDKGNTRRKETTRKTNMWMYNIKMDLEGI
jgi:hypothetical protein